MNKHLLDQIILKATKRNYKYDFLKTKDVIFNPVYLETCKSNACGRYGKNWYCPPAIGDINELIKKYSSFSDTLIISSIVELEDSFDIEAMDAGRNDLFNFYISLIKEHKLYNYSNIKILGCSSCDLCSECTYPHSECRFKELLVPTIESCGIDVCNTVRRTKLSYYNGPNTVTYFCFIFFNRHNLIINGTTIECRSGDNLLELLRGNNFNIEASCGGLSKCGKCLVNYNNEKILSCLKYIDEDAVVSFQEKNDYGLTHFSEIKSVSSKSTGMGLSVDLGTTTIAFHLVDLEKGIIVDASSRLNPQQIYGSDVMTRINECKNGKLSTLNECIVDLLSSKMNELKLKYQFTKFEKVYVSGNTTMLHILANVNPETLGTYPFTPKFLELKTIEINNQTVTLLPSISSFIGSDITSGIIATNILNSDGNTLLIDIGTNGEMVLKSKNGTLATSTAAGPAFEGASIEMGVGGIDGAINKVEYLDGKLVTHTINDKLPIGICGSGLIDIISILLEEKLIDQIGIFQDSSSELEKYLNDDKFYLSNNVYITQKDISEVILAKSAIRSGINILMNELNVDCLDEIYLCGGFGFFLNVSAAQKIGLIPNAKNIKVWGNTSSSGTIMCLLNDENVLIGSKVKEKVETINLSLKEEFEEEFINNMIFEGE